MAITLSTPGPQQLPGVHEVLRRWQRPEGPFHLHPGDLGWAHTAGAGRVAAQLRLWQRDGHLAALGMLDGDAVLRTAIDPALVDDVELAEAMADDLGSPGQGIFPGAEASIEAHSARRLREVLAARGWTGGEQWVPLRLDLADEVDVPGVVVEEMTARTRAEFAAVHRAAFSSGASEEKLELLDRSPAARDFAWLIGRAPDGEAAAIVTVWSAGPGRPGLLEPMGVHPDYRGRGLGRAICRAAAAHLRGTGASHALVCTPRDLPGAVRTYVSAGFVPGPAVGDLDRPLPR